MSELPEGWARPHLRDLVTFVTSGSRGWARYYADEGAAFVRVGNIKRGTISLDWEDMQRVKPPPGGEGERTRLQDDDVLITITADLGRVAVFQEGTGEAYINQHVALARLVDGQWARYVAWYLTSEAGHAQLLERDKGTTKAGLGLDDIHSVEVPFPPIAEQRQIVTKVDALTARTARARADLDRIPALAARYKQAVLANAFSGELTAEWRKAAEAAKPWQEVSIGEIAAITSGFGFPKDRQGLTEGDYPFAKVSDISRAVANDGGLLSKAANYVRKADLVTLRAKPVPVGSVVFAKIGEALRLNRRALATTEVILDNNCMALSPDVSRVAPRFLYQFMKTVDLSPFAVATAVPSIRRGDVASLRLPLPPLAEQVEIDRRIEVAFNEIDRLTAEAASARRLLDHLDQAVLAKAFRGELVPQDPTDESASVLLDRIKAEREAEDRKPKSRGGRKPNGSKEQAMNGKPLSPRERILKDSENWPALGLPFEAIATRNAMPHDQLRDALFELLGGSSPALQQRFDADGELMVIQRVAA